jgi:hypothetical protein
MNPLIRLNKSTPFVIALLLSCFALLPRAQAVVPAPDGGYPGFNTAEGQNALFSLTTGAWNTALGFQALNNDTAGANNTATGARALFSNTTGFSKTQPMERSPSLPIPSALTTVPSVGARWRIIR